MATVFDIFDRTKEAAGEVVEKIGDGIGEVIDAKISDEIGRHAGRGSTETADDKPKVDSQQTPRDSLAGNPDSTSANIDVFGVRVNKNLLIGSGVVLAAALVAKVVL